MTKKSNSKSSAMNAEIKALILANQATKEGVTPDPVAVPKPHRVEKEAVDRGLHTLAQGMLKAEAGYDKASNAVYTAFKTYALAALPIIERMPAHLAALQDIREVFGEARQPAAIQRVTMLNNMRTIAYGKVATRDTPAQEAQGAEVVIDALNASNSLPALKKMLSSMKTVKHAATGAAKLPNAAKSVKAVKTTSSASEPEHVPNTRKEAIEAACRLLGNLVSMFLQPGTDADIIVHAEELIGELKEAA